MSVFLEYGYEEADIQIVPDNQLNWIATGPMMDVGSPTPVSAVINGGAQYTTDPNVTVRVHARDFSSGVRYVHLSNNDWTTTHIRDLPPAEGEFVRDIPWNLTTNSPGDGLKSVWVKFCDAQNFCSGNYELQPAQITLNTAPPTGVYSSPSPGTLVRDTATLAVNVTDNGSGIQYVEFKAQYGGTWRTLHKDYIAPYQFVWDVTGVPDNDQIVLGGNVVDNMGRIGTITTRTISKDRTPPVSTGVTASGEPPTHLASKVGDPDSLEALRSSSEFVRDTVTLQLDAEDNQSGVGTVQFLGYFSGTWNAIGSLTTAPYQFTWNMVNVPDGPVSAKAVVSDVAGNSQELPPVQFVKDTVAPTQASDIRLANRPGAFTNETRPEFIWTAASDDRSGLAGYYIAINDWTPDGEGELDWVIANVSSWKLPEPLTPGTYWVALTSRDRSGNVNPVNTNQQGDAPYLLFTIDLVPPTSSVAPLAAQQAGSVFTVTWSGSDDVAGIAGYDVQFREDDGPWLNWLVGTTLTQGTFHGEPERTYAFRSRAHDAAGNTEAYPTQPDATTTTGPSVVTTTMALTPGWNLMTWPLLLADITLDGSLGAQLHGTDSPDTADRVLYWDAATQSYQSAWFCGGPECESWGEPYANRWLASDYSPSTITIPPNAGFWIQNRSGESETLTILGMAAEDEHSVPVAQGWQMLGSIFAAELPLDEANLPATGTDSPDTADRVLYWDAATQSYKSAWFCGGPECESWGEPYANRWLASDYSPTDIVIQPGHGFWYQNRHQPFIWINAR